MRIVTEEKITKKIIKIIKKICKVKVVPAVNLVNELSIDSIHVFEIFLMVEKSFKICFEENEIVVENLNDISKLTALVLKKVQPIC